MPRKAKATTAPIAVQSFLPAPLEAELQKIAGEILTERSIESRKVAALELANKLLSKTNALLKIAFDVKATNATVAFSPAAVKNPCVNCGREGTFRPKPDRFNKKPGWLCNDHAAFYNASQLEERTGDSLLATLRNAAPIDEDSLPAE